MTPSDKNPEPTPIGDEAEAAAAQPTETTKPSDSAPDAEPTPAPHLIDADPVDVTTFDEDDDPVSLAGDFIDEDGDGVDDRLQGGKN